MNPLFTILEGYCACKYNYLLCCSIPGGKTYKAPFSCLAQRAHAQTYTDPPARKNKAGRKGPQLSFSIMNLFKVLLLYLDASALQKILADVSTVVLNCVLIYELLAHN